MRKNIALAVLALVLMVAPLGIVAGSDITGALYKLVITVADNGTAATNVSTVCTLSTPNLITGGYANSGANNIALRSSTGVDVPFMPGYGTNPMVLFVPTVGASSYVQNLLYTATSTGGDIVYFPDSVGMSVPDSATLEPGSIFNLEIQTFVDTSTSDNIVEKGSPFRMWNLNSFLYFSFTDNSSSIVEQSVTNGVYTCSASSMFGSQTFTTTGALSGITIDLIYTGSPYGISYAPTPSGTDPLTIELKATAAGLPVGAALATASIPSDNLPYRVSLNSALAPLTKYAVVISSPTTISPRSWLWGINTAGSLPNGNLAYSTDNGSSWTDVPAYDTVSSGLHTLQINHTGAALSLSVDGVAVDTLATALAVTNTAYNWVWGGDSTPYIKYIKQSVGGTPIAYWDWEYAATFTDNISSIAATPTFRTTTSNGSVTASAGAFSIIDPAEASASALATPSDFYHTPTISGTFTTGTVTPTYPGADVITAIAAASGTPSNLPFTIITGVVILILSLSVSALMRRGGSGSLIIKMVLIAGLLGVAVALQVFDLWMPIVFLLLAAALAMGSQQRGWN
jgi:hypothetical protein